MHNATSAIWIEITATRGSAPRDAGTAMMVTPSAITGTIGGGALENRAIATARRILNEGRAETTETIPLGPSLGQCCGGAVALRYTYQECRTDATKPTITHEPAIYTPAPLWVWGAGHVGRAVVQTCPPQAFQITWIDSYAARFPRKSLRISQLLPLPTCPALLSTRHAPPII